MNVFEYSPFNDVYVPYIYEQNQVRPNRIRAIWNALGETQLPLVARWVLYNAMRSM